MACALALAGCGTGTGSDQPGALTIALAEDPDELDPTISSTFVARIVFAHMCEKLYDVGDGLSVVPQLASALPKASADGKTVTIPLRQGLKFNDGTAFDAAAVKQSLDRHRTLEASSRSGELEPVSAVEVVDDHTVRLKLTQRFAPLTSLLADRAGMIMSPEGARRAGRQVQLQARSASARSSSRSASRRTASCSSARPTTTTRRRSAATRSPSRSSPRARCARPTCARATSTSPSAWSRSTSSRSRATTRSSLTERTSLGYQGITINIGNTDGVGKPFKTARHAARASTPSCARRSS